MKDPHCYDDIIGLPHFVSKDRRHMSGYDRAAQFAPFAALTGYHEKIDETGRITDDLIENGDDRIEELDRRFRILAAHIMERPAVRIEYFVPDLYKEGGSYRKAEFTVRKIDLDHRLIISDDRERFDLDYIIRIDSGLFEAYNI